MRWLCHVDLLVVGLSVGEVNVQRAPLKVFGFSARSRNIRRGRLGGRRNTFEEPEYGCEAYEEEMLMKENAHETMRRIVGNQQRKTKTARRI